MIEAMQEWILREKLLPASSSTRTLWPTADTWEAFLSHDVERSPFASDAVLHLLGHVDVSVPRLPTTRGTAAALGRMQTGR